MADDIFKLLGRILIASFFIWICADMAMAPSVAMGKIRGIGLPYPGVAYAILILIMGLCSLCLLVGYKARLAAMILFVGWVAVVVLFHLDFSSNAHITKLLEKAAIMGGILYVYASGAGKYQIRV